MEFLSAGGGHGAALKLHYTREEAEQLFNGAVKALSGKNRARECLEVLRALIQMLLVSPSRMQPPKQLVPALCAVLIEKNLPPRLRALCEVLLKEFAEDEPEPLKSSLSDRQLLPVIYPAMLSLSDRNSFSQTLPSLVRWVASQDPSMRAAAFPALIMTLRRCDQLPYNQVQPLEVGMAEWLGNAKNASEQKKRDSGVGNFFGLNSASSMVVLELDGTPAQSFFTVLNNVGVYSEDQISNIFSFSIVHAWLQLLYSGRSQTAESDFASQFREVVIKYCMRVIEQSKQKAIIESGGIKTRTATFINRDFPDVVLYESIRILDLICKYVPAQVPRLFPTIKKIYNLDSSRGNGHVFLGLLQFFTNHSKAVVYDPEPVFRTFFEIYLANNYTNHLVAFETIHFFLNNKKRLLQRTNVFSLYFPPLFKLLAWSPQSYVREFGLLLPAFVSSSTFIELFHTLLDLPLLTAALERMEYEKTTETSATSSEYRALYNYILRNESGVSINFWESALDILSSFFQITPITPRVTAMGSVVIALLSIYFDVLVLYASEQCVSEILPVMFERMDQLFPHTEFQAATRDLLVQKVLAIFNRYPSFVVTHKALAIEILTDSTHPSRGELILNLIWAVGEYASTSICPECSSDVLTEYHESLETFAYERMAMVQSASVSSTSSAALEGEKLYTTRVLLVVISALAKLAARWQDLASRVILFLAKVLRQRETLHPSVIRRAGECVQILKFPSIASAILDTPASLSDRDPLDSHVDKNSSLPFLLLQTTEVPRGEPLHAFELTYNPQPPGEKQ